MLTNLNKLTYLCKDFMPCLLLSIIVRISVFFLTEYCKIKHQLTRIIDFQASELVIKSVVVRKLPFQTFDKICDLYVTHDFTLEQMEAGIQHIVDKLDQAVLALAKGAVIKQVGVNSQSQNPPSKQSKSKRTIGVCIAQVSTSLTNALSITQFSLVRIES